ncbi:uncharacterized protein LOC143546016 [Bidens hawaiensis]|uniref:uncharacterized protein LOC143546016 n=1 Tax=Bidens hawaiensis TaxID=980011 RepID=UPI00404B63B1
MKLDSLIKDLKDKQLLGKVQAVVYTVEYQKRGLPHAHICIFLYPDSKLSSVEDIDPKIFAEIPNKDEDPVLYSFVKDFMIHGPCGAYNPKCSCMIDNKCSKNFPKRFSENTCVDTDGFPIYKRPDNRRYVDKSGFDLDNGYVVPYSKYLLKRYQGHINVEWCNQSGSIKYLFKYINNGPDRATISVGKDNNHDEQEDVDEIKEYYDCRYLSACEATWRILAYDVHYRIPSVTRLPFHLPGKQSVVYGADEDVDNVLEKESVSSSMFTSWMKCNQLYEEARQLTYVEFPTKFTWKLEQKHWERRKSGCSIGRIHAISLALGDAYFLRVLLNKVKGPQSFEDIRTVNGKLHETFRDACFELGLLDDDSEYIEAIKEVSHSGTGFYIRSLFVTMLTSHSLSRPDVVWNNTWELLSDGILYNQRRMLNSPALPDEEIKNLTLCEIEKILLRNANTLKNFETMPFPDYEFVASSNNPLINEELSYDKEVQNTEYNILLSSLTDEQRIVFEEIMNVITLNKGGSFFVYGYGGTGKTFLWKNLVATIRSKGEIVINVASSGIASLLLSSRTAHSRFHIPINLNETSSCNIKPFTDESHLLTKTSLIIWDEAPMTHKHAFESLDRTLRDILGCRNQPFGGKVIVFGGDFRQILPVVQHGTRQDVVLRLTKKMRLTIGCDSSNIEQARLFAKWFLDLGEEKVGGPSDGETEIEIPDDLLIKDSLDPLSDLIEFVYPDILSNYKNKEFFEQRAVLAPTNEVVEQINNRLLEMLPGSEYEYLSSDSVCFDESFSDSFDERLYAPDILNGLNISMLSVALLAGNPFLLLEKKFGNYLGEPSASNNYYVSKLFIDEDIPAINVFKQSNIENGGALSSSSQRSISSSSVCMVNEDFLERTPFNLIAEIEIDKIKSVIILATIVYIPPIQEWHYFACGGNSYSSSRYNRYCFINIWDKEAFKILNVTAESLVEETKGSFNIPTVFNIMLQRKYAFKIDIKEYYILKNSMNFNIAKLSEDSFIVNCLEKKSNTDMVEISEQNPLTGGDCRSEDTVNNNELISITGENSITPISNGDTNRQSSPPSDLKRKLGDIYDIDDDAVANSTNKSKEKQVSCDISGDNNLLIPKKEK